MSFTSMNSPFQSPSSSPGLLRGGSMVAGVEVSVITGESHTLNNTVTKVALESGAQVTDHVIVEPDEVSVSFAMTNAGSGAEAARDAFESFKRMRDERTLLELITEHHVYDNMVVASVTPNHKAPYKGALEITVKLQRVSFVELQSAGRDPGSLTPRGKGGKKAQGKIKGKAGRISKTGSKKVSAGKQNPKKPEDNRTGAAKAIDEAKKRWGKKS